MKSCAVNRAVPVGLRSMFTGRVLRVQPQNRSFVSAPSASVPSPPPRNARLRILPQNPSPRYYYAVSPLRPALHNFASNLPALSQVVIGLFIACTLLFCTHAAAYDSEVTEAAPPFPISSKFSRTIQKYTGINKLTEFTVSHIAALCIKTKLGGHVKVSLRVYSFTDLLSGKIKSVVVKLSGSSYRGVPLGNVTLASNNPVWYHPFKSRKLQLGLQAPLLVKLDGTVGGADLSKLLTADTALTSKIGKLELPGMGQQRLVFFKPSAAVTDGKICIKSTVSTAGAAPATGVNLVITGIPYLADSKVMLKDLNVFSADIVDPAAFSSFVESVSNPLFNLARLDRRNHALRLDFLAVEGNSVKYGGKLLVAPVAVAAK